MMNRRDFVLGLGPAALAASLVARARPARASGTVSVALIMTGPITDGGWAQLAYEGLEKLKGMGGFKVSYAENVKQANLEDVVRGYADDGNDLIIGHGYEFGSAFLDIAPSYPDQKFFASTFKPQDKVPENCEFVDLAYFGASYGAGALAALISEKGKAVGYVGGGDNPTQQRMKACFIGGAEQTRKGIKGLGIITGDYDNAAKGSEAANAMISNGADVIWHGANVTGLGAIQAAAAAGVKVLGCYSDQQSVAPDHMGTSFVMNLGWMVIEVAKSVADGSFRGGSEWKPKVTDMWSLKAGKFGDHNPAVISDAAWSKFGKIWAELGSGELDVAKLVPKA